MVLKEFPYIGPFHWPFPKRRWWSKLNSFNDHPLELYFFSMLYYCTIDFCITLIVAYLQSCRLAPFGTCDLVVRTGDPNRFDSAHLFLSRPKIDLIRGSEISLGTTIRQFQKCHGFFLKPPTCAISLKCAGCFWILWLEIIKRFCASALSFHSFFALTIMWSGLWKLLVCNMRGYLVQKSFFSDWSK